MAGGRGTLEGGIIVFKAHIIHTTTLSTLSPVSVSLRINNRCQRDSGGLIIDKDCKNLFCQLYETVVPNVYMNNPAEHRGYSFLFN